MLGVVDYAVLAATLVVSSAIGLYYRRQGSSAEKYLLAGGQVSAFPVAFSLMASFMSAITLLGLTYENYAFGTQFVAINVAYIIGTPIAAYIYLPVFFRLKSPSAYAYLDRRFGLPTRLVASLAFSVQMVLYMGIVLYAPALALSAVTGLSYTGSIIVVGIVCTFYSTVGGMKAVLVTDVFQSILMFVSILAVVCAGIGNAGSIRKVIEVANEGGRLNFFEFTLDPTERHTFWTQIIGGTFVYLSIYAVNQAQVQRLLSTKSVQKGQLALWLQWPILTALSLATSFAGLTIYAFYKDCDPIKTGRIEKGDQVLPLFVMDTMSGKPGLAGLFVSGIFSGSLSTVSSAINSLAAVTMEDYIKPFFQVNPGREGLYLRLLAMAFGLSSVGLTFLVEAMGPGVLQASLTIFGVVGGPLLGLFTLGMFTSKPGQKSALTGLVTGLGLLFWIGFGRPKPPVHALPTFTNGTQCHLGVEPGNFTNSHVDGEEDYFYPYCISYAWYALLGFVITFGVGWTVSAPCWSGKSGNRNPDMFVDWKRNKLMMATSQNDTKEPQDC